MYSFFLKLSRLMAFLGGVMLALLVLLVCLSIAGRSLNGVLHGDWVQGVMPGLANWLLALGIGPVRGDFEMVEAGIAFCIFAFLPLCQITGGHAAVDIFVDHMSQRFQRAMRLITDLAFAAVMVLIAVQLYGGTMSKVRSGQTTLLLEFPVWWGYALSLIGAVVAAAVAVFLALTRLREVATGRVILPADLGAGH